MLLSEITKILEDTVEKDGDCGVTAGQIRTGEGVTILTVVIPYKRILKDQTEG